MERAAGVLAGCLLVGALANAAAGMIQFYGPPEALRDFVAELHHDPLHNGAYGNIGAIQSLRELSCARRHCAAVPVAARQPAHPLCAGRCRAAGLGLRPVRLARRAAVRAVVRRARRARRAQADRRRSAPPEIRRLWFGGRTAGGATGRTLAQRRAASRPREPGRIRTPGGNIERPRRSALAALAPGLAYFRQRPGRRRRYRRICRRRIQFRAPPGLDANRQRGLDFTPQFGAATSGRDRRPGHVPRTRRLVHLVVAGRAALFRRAPAGDVVDYRRGRNRDDSFDVRIPAVEHTFPRRHSASDGSGYAAGHAFAHCIALHLYCSSGNLR